MLLERLQKIHSKSKSRWGGGASQNVCAGPPLSLSLSCEWLFPSEKIFSFVIYRVSFLSYMDEIMNEVFKLIQVSL